MTGRAVITGHGWYRRSGSASISHLDHAAHQAVRHLSTCARQRPSAPSGAASDTSDEWRDGDEKNLDEYKAPQIQQHRDAHRWAMARGCAARCGHLHVLFSFAHISEFPTLKPLLATPRALPVSVACQARCSPPSQLVAALGSGGGSRTVGGLLWAPGTNLEWSCSERGSLPTLLQE